MTLVKNTLTRHRLKNNDIWLCELVGHELYYIYGLVNMETGEVGYIGTTYDPHKRQQHHEHDLRRFRGGTYNRQSRAKVEWMANQPDPPEMKIFAICTTREDAEFIERGLVKEFEMQGNYHYWKYVPRPEGETVHQTDFLEDDIPY